MQLALARSALDFLKFNYNFCSIYALLINMKETYSMRQDTPPSSVNGDEIEGMDDEMYFEEVEEVQLEDLENMLEEQEEDTEMQPPEDHSIMAFKKHIGSAFCCDLHPRGSLAVTGGEDDKAYVWSVETGNVLVDCIGHKDSVIFVGFSYDGAYLATADMAGLIKVWEVKTFNTNEPWPVAFEYETEDISWGSWHFGARVLIFGVESGDIYVFKVPSGETKVLKGHNVKVECGKLFPDGRRLATGYDDGAVKIWDLKTSSLVSQVPANVQGMKVTALDVQSDNNLVASISLDGKVVITTPNNGKVVGQLQAEIDLETVAFSNEPSGYLALGTLTGAVSIWDTARQMIRHQCVKAEEGSGVTKIQWIKNHLVTGCLDGSVRVYEGRTGERKLLLTGHESAILDLCYNAEKKLILTTSDDDSARVFQYEVNNDND